MTCKVVGTPKPEITWFKGGQAIKKSKDFNMELVGETAKLTINDGYVDDSGDYTCEVWNEAGTQTSPFKITIKEKKGKPKRSRPKPPESTKKDEDEARKEKRKADAAKKAEEKAAAAAAAAAAPGL